ncbi:hypothetical protein [Caulobacter soli]|uniref:hypothetical protein n=1 Tax=Caulobacter soli TaxID=2708539 RepID=UPI0013EA83C7|nr:hypothetical protein [Caulobacter soli]
MGKPWFRVKRYGFGAGLPCSWEGWLMTAGFMALVLGSSILAEQHAGWRLAIILVAVAVFCVITRVKSDAPWKWRWGQE